MQHAITKGISSGEQYALTDLPCRPNDLCVSFLVPGKKKLEKRKKSLFHFFPFCDKFLKGMKNLFFYCFL